MSGGTEGREGPAEHPHGAPYGHCAAWGRRPLRERGPQPGGMRISCLAWHQEGVVDTS